MNERLIVHSASRRLVPRSVLLVALALAALAVAALAAAGPVTSATEPSGSSVDGTPTADAAAAAVAHLVERHGETERPRIEQGVDQVQRLWRVEDGDAEAFRAFVETEFLPQGETLDATFARFEFASERLGGYLTSLIRDLRLGSDIEVGPLLPLDGRLAGFDPGAHLTDDLFASRIAFVALLNFPFSSLEERLADGDGWTRRQWAEARLTEQFSSRVPADVNQRISANGSVSYAYISGYNIYMHHLLADDGSRPFPAGLRLISHWGLRDELKARYADPDGLPRQRMIQRVFDRIVRQEIPDVVVNNPLVDWNPFTNEVTVSTVEDVEAPAGASAAASASREPDTRYDRWLENFKAQSLADPFQPDNPSLIARRFNVDRQIPEERVEALFVEVLGSPLGVPAAQLVESRLDRPLEPFDIWYTGFRSSGKIAESELDAVTRERYPDADAFAADMPRILEDLGFAADRARFVADHVVVEPSRGVGHAFGAARRDDKAHLRTRVGQDGMDYKGYNIAVHEFGHNVEQVFSVTSIDHTLLQGVPNTAFTEALAFVFQHRDLELLGVGGDDPAAAQLSALDTFWATREIAGVALVDMRVWRWLYKNPDATPAELREAVLDIAREVWNEYFAELFGVRDVTLLAVYSHMISRSMYTPDYPLGHLIAFQIESYFEGTDKPFGAEFERICQLGSLTPDLWMRRAVGAPLTATPLLEATAVALEAVRQ